MGFPIRGGDVCKLEGRSRTDGWGHWILWGLLYFTVAAYFDGHCTLLLLYILMATVVYSCGIFWGWPYIVIAEYFGGHCRQSTQEGDKVVSPTHRPPLPLQAIVRQEGLRQ
jgi:hypothetical protein